MKKMIILLGCVGCMMLSCTHDEPNNSSTGTGQRVVEWEDSTLSGDAVMGMKMLFNVGNVMSVDRQVSTRSTTEYNGTCAFTTNDLIAVAVTRSGASEVVKLYRVKSDGSLEYAGGDNDPFVWKSTGETVSIRAWSYGTTNNLAYTLTPPESRDYTLETDQNTNGYLELIYCKAADKSYSGGTISLNFYHQLARVVFNIKHQKRATLSVSSVSVGNSTSQLPLTASFTPPSAGQNVGTWTIKSTVGTITPKTEDSQPNYDKTYSAVIFPKTYAQNTKLFTLTNGEGNYVYNVSETAGASLTAGNQYNYSITVKDVVPLLPIQYLVGTHNMQTNTTMASDDRAVHSKYFYWGTNSTTPSSNIKNFINGIKISSKWYHLPSLLEWMSVMPPLSPISADNSAVYQNAVEGEGDKRVSFRYENFNQTGLGEMQEWGRMKDGSYAVPARMYYNEYASNPTGTYYRAGDGDNRIFYAYAIRHKDKDIAGPSGYGKYTCAYRYAYMLKDPDNDYGSSLRIKVCYLGASSTTTLSSIINFDYWQRAGETYYEVMIPANSRTEINYADANPPSLVNGVFEGVNGYYWSSTSTINSSGSHCAFWMHFRSYDIMSSNCGSIGYGFGVRLFADTE